MALKPAALLALCLLSSGALASPAAAAGDAQKGYAELARPLLQKYCQRCHGEVKPKGGFRLQDLKLDFGSAITTERWGAVAEELAAQRMPPRDETQPPPEAAKALVAWIETQVTSTAARASAAMVLRRLNRDEYRNTVAELTGIEPDISAFPVDPPVGGFSNNRRALVMTPVHLELFADLARTTLDRALVEGARPKAIRWRFDPETGEGHDHRVPVTDGQRPIVHRDGNPRNGDFTVMKVPEWAPQVRDFRVPREGDYIVRVRAGGRVPSHQELMTAVERELRRVRDQEQRAAPGRAADFQREYERRLLHFRQDPNYRYGAPRMRVTLTLGPQSLLLGELDVEAPVAAPQVYEFRARFSRENAFIRPEYAYRIPTVLENHEMIKQGWFPKPEVWLDSVELEGPVHDAWPPQSHVRLLGARQPGMGEREHARVVLERFMPRAYRRPVSPAEVEAKLVLYDHWRKQSGSFVEAIKGALTAVLTSPNFLYLVEPAAPPGQAAPAGPAAPRELNDFELASRLSYFLWSTMPDGELLQLASQGRLRDPATLAQQTERMLRDRRARALSVNFAGEWLGLANIGTNPPSPELYPHYDRHLETSIARESEAFFAEILRSNRSVLNFLRSDFVVINERLGRFYGIEGVKGDAFRVVPVPAGVQRGGLATQAAMLSMTSNGTRTSPVKRGVWLLKTLLDADPGLPLADAGEIPPKVPGVDRATVRARLEAHREQPRCARCHEKIDPLGFALENYDAAGRWREQEASGWKGGAGPEDPRVDARARMPDGTPIEGAAGLSRELVKQADQFRRCLMRKLLGYALGREITFADVAAVKDGVSTMKRNGDHLRAAITYVVASPVFRTR